jgi:hypothetical protein
MSDAIPPNTQTTELDETDQVKRIELIFKPRWIGYPKAESITELLERPSEDGKARLAVIHGPAYNGQNALVERLERRAKKKISNIISESGRAQIPVRLVIVPASPTVPKLFGQILKDLEFGIRSRGANENQVGARLQLQGTNTLILVQAANLIKAPECGAMLAGLLNIRDRYGISVILVTVTEVLSRLNENSAFKQLAEIHELPAWSFDEDFEDLLAAFEGELGLKKSSPALAVSDGGYDRKSAMAILEHSRYTLGHIVKTIQRAGEYAINSQIEQINREVLLAIGVKVPR